MQTLENPKIAIIGLGYVGLPLAIEFAKIYSVFGYDIDTERISNLQIFQDRTNEANIKELRTVCDVKDNIGLTLSAEIDSIKDCSIFIVTVPTPVDEEKKPNLKPLFTATESIGRILKKDNIVIFESTVYPGCTEEDCVPILEQNSGLKYNIDFYCGYSPERINPGDKVHTLTKIKKVTSGSTPDAAVRIDNLYKSIIVAGTHLAPSIKVAEASKAIENAQRDINISFVNELALIFDKMNIDTTDVLAAAATKWNFLNYSPGLVGGHCIGVDPYYLAYKSEQLGYKPEVILSGRKVNDNMGVFVANKVVKLMIEKDKKIKGARALILGFSFKENCPDTRNTKVIDIVNEFNSYGLITDVYDPWIDQELTKNTYNINLIQEITDYKYDAVILAVGHSEFLNIDFNLFKQNKAIVFDAKSILPKNLINGRL